MANMVFWNDPVTILLSTDPKTKFRARRPSKTEDEGAFMLQRSSKTAHTYETLARTPGLNS